MSDKKKPARVKNRRRRPSGHPGTAGVPRPDGGTPAVPGWRAAAEEKLARTPPGKTTGKSAESILHELRVHQIELEMQNDELKRAQVALEESRDKYVDLYDFAPVGYFTLTRVATTSGL